MSADQVQALFGPSEKLASLASSRAEKEASRGAAAEQKALDREARKDTARIVSAGMAGTRQMAAEDRRAKQEETLIQKASKDYETPASMVDAMDTIRAAAGDADPAGVGRVSGRLSSWGIGSEKALENRQAMATMGNAILRGRAGQAVTPSEAERVQIETGMAPGATEEQFKTGAKAILRVMDRANANLAAKYPQATRDEIKARGGWVPGAQPGPARPASPAGPPQISSVEEYQALPSGTAYIDPNGKPKVKR